MTFTVVTKTGQRYFTTLLIATIHDGVREPALSFLCSGRMMTFLADQVAAIEVGGL